MIAYEVNAFTTTPSGGSPTGVVLGAGELSDDAMQRIARQFPFSHTAFVVETDNGAEVGIRFFTPLREIANCAHATIAAHVARASTLTDKRDFTLRQRAKVGVQEVKIQHTGDAITVYFRQNEVTFTEVERYALLQLRAYLRLPHAALDSNYPVLLASPGENRFMLPLKDHATLHGLKPDFAGLKALCRDYQSIGCFAFTLETAPPDFEATGRMFAPAIGVDEDIINGNSSGCLGAYLLRMSSADELRLSVHQGHAAGRTGTVLVTARRVDERIETWVGGTGVVVRELALESS